MCLFTFFFKGSFLSRLYVSCTVVNKWMLVYLCIKMCTLLAYSVFKFSHSTSYLSAIRAKASSKKFCPTSSFVKKSSFLFKLHSLFLFLLPSILDDEDSFVEILRLSTFIYFCGSQFRYFTCFGLCSAALERVHVELCSPPLPADFRLQATK